MFKALDTTTNLLRALAALSAVALVGIGGWLGYRSYHAGELALQAKQEALARTEARVAHLEKDLEAKAREVERLETAVRLLKVDRRLAVLDVVDQRPSETAGVETEFTFAETDEAGDLLEEPRTYVIEGDIVYIDGLVIKFQDDYIERGDELRGASLFLFRRIFGQHQQPSDGFPLDEVGQRPAAYSRGDPMSDFQRQLWANFWEYATDPKKAAAAGVRAAHGQAAYQKLVPGKRYRILFRSTGDITFTPEDQPARGRPAL